MKLNDIKMKKKLFLSYLLIIVIPIIVLGLYSYYQAKSLLLKRSLDFAQSSVDTFLIMTNNKIDNLVSGVNFIAYNSSMYDIFNQNYDNYYDVYENITQQIEPIVRAVRSVNGDIGELTIYTESNITKRAQFIRPLDELRTRAWYEQLKSSFDIQIIVQSDHVIFARGLVGQYKNTYENYVVLTVPIDRLLSGASVISSPGAYMGLYNNEKISVSNDISSKFMPSELPSQFAALAEKDYITLDENIVIKGSESLFGMQFYFSKPTKDILLNADSIVWVTVGIAAGCFLLLLATTMFLSNAMVKRIETLSEKIALVQKGNLYVEMTDNSKDEIGCLSVSFGNMLVTLRQLIDDIYESEAHKKEAEINLLHAQIKPHFLYNILSVINWKAISLGVASISQVALSASAFYRTSLNNGKNTIDVGSELKNIEAYIELQKIMHDPAFVVHFDVNESVKTCEMANFILQPIVENAIKHGLDNKRVGQAELFVSAELRGEFIEFCIRDNGPGMDSEKLAAIKNFESSGYGIKNIREKLTLFYNEDFTFEITSQLLEGTTVSLKIPAKLQGHKKATYIK